MIDLSILETMLKPADLRLEDMGDLADIIPPADPEVKALYRTIPSFDDPQRRKFIPVCEPTLAGNELEVRTTRRRDKLDLLGR